MHNLLAYGGQTPDRWRDRFCAAHVAHVQLLIRLADRPTAIGALDELAVELGPALNVRPLTLDRREERLRRVSACLDDGWRTMHAIRPTRHAQGPLRLAFSLWSGAAALCRAAQIESAVTADDVDGMLAELCGRLQLASRRLAPARASAATRAHVDDALDAADAAQRWMARVESVASSSP